LALLFLVILSNSLVNPAGSRPINT